ncbi:MAG: pyridoxine 5'-phosphate oxidase C-terminal domain-containing protein [Candidatus Berkiellales bacterium]
MPRSAFWGGYVLIPHLIEFWQGREHRLHDRFEYRKDAAGAWQIVQLSP